MEDRHKGFVALGLTVVCWVGSSELMQWMEEGHGYNRPVAITMSCALSFLLYGGAAFLRDDSSSRKMLGLFKELGVVAGTFALLWISANLAFTASLARTSSASAVTIASSSSAFALVCSVAAGVERFSRRKLGAVALACVGTGLTCVADTGDASHPEQLLGDSLALASAVMYALYLVLYQKDVDKSVSTEDFLFVVGVWAAMLMPITTYFEPLVMPTSKQTLALLINAVVGTAISERAWLYGASKCGPTTATMALSLTIPFTAAVDFIRGRLDGIHGAVALAWVTGLVLICSGFVLSSTDNDTRRSPSPPRPDRVGELGSGKCDAPTAASGSQTEYRGATNCRNNPEMNAHA
eukprot:m.154860 g.154860  ORF g.154860 m.154860 type:complete len:352 (+) comp14388_c0_seq2:297-1352(+)